MTYSVNELLLSIQEGNIWFAKNNQKRPNVTAQFSFNLFPKMFICFANECVTIFHSEKIPII